MDKNRHQFQVRPGEALGDKLIWRFPLATPEGRDALRPVLDAERLAARNTGQQLPTEPESVTVGYYRRLDKPPGAWAFGPVNTERALAALTVPAVMDRIADDLIRLTKPTIKRATT